MKKLYVDGKLVAMGDYTIEEHDEPQKYHIKIEQQGDYERDELTWWNECTKFYSCHKGFTWDGKAYDCLKTEDDKSCDDFSSYATFIEALNKSKTKKYYPVFGYDHSGIAVSKTPFADKWDSGLFGIAEVDLETAATFVVRSCDGRKQGMPADDIFDAFFVELHAMMSGEVYRVQVLDELNNPCEWYANFYGRTNDDVIECIYDSIESCYNITKEDVEEAFSKRFD